jgi:hypothetical protein
MAVGILPIAATFVALRNRRVGAWLLLIPSAVIALWWATSLGQPPVGAPSGDRNIGWLLAVFSLLLVPGTFWLFTSWFGWPRTLFIRFTYKRLIAAVVVLCGSVLVGSATMSLRSEDIPVCHGLGRPPFTKQLSPQHTVFTARLVATGLLWPERWQGRGAPMKYWALAVVDRHFWGLPWWNRKLAILMLETNGGQFFHKGDIDFVEASRLPGPVTRFLPIYDLSCSRTKHLGDAEVDLRILRDGPPLSGMRILGRTIREDGGRKVGVAGAKVEIYSRTTGLFTVISDDNAIFDVPGLPHESYDVREAGRVGWHYDCCNTRRSPQQAGYICDCSVWVH